MSQAPSVPIQSSSLYVGDLDPAVSESDLFEVFNGVGAVASIRVCRDKANKTSLGYAYVNYHSTNSAAEAIEQLNSALIKGKKCRVMFSQRDPSLRKSGVGNIFIKNLNKTIDSKALYDTFAFIGTIVSCKVAVDDKGVSKGYGFVQYESEEMADRAIEKINQMDIAGQEVYVGKFISRKERITSQEMAKVEPRFTNVYVKNLPETIDEKGLRDMFAPFGDITSLLLRVDDKGRSKGFGFINFRNYDNAKKAVDELNGKEIEGKALYVSRAQIKSERVKELAQKFRSEATPIVAHQQPNNLYIKNLGDDIDDNRLHAEFSVYGNIISAHIMRDAKGESKGFGFVCYTSAEEASTAMGSMNGRIFGSKPISIFLAQRKEDRRQLLVAQHAQNLKQGLFAHNQMTPVSPMGAPIFFQPQIQQMYSQHSPFQYAPIMQQQGRWAQPNYPYQHMPNYHQMQAGGGRRQFQRQGNGNRPNRSFRNQPQQVINEAPAAAAVQAQVVEPLLTAEDLAKNTLESQSAYIGERLYPLISQSHPDLAGKVTGMFLDRLRFEGGIQELLNILNDPNVLAEKIHEALEVLKNHSQAENGQ